MLVDDDRQNSELLRKFLEVEGYEVDYAENGRAGWEMYAANRPDLVLLDINMPEMNGFELARKIREQDRDVLIFFLTDRTEKADRLKGFDLKGNDYIPKPFYPEELIAKIKERFEHLADIGYLDVEGEGVGITIVSPDVFQQIRTFYGLTDMLS